METNNILPRLCGFIVAAVLSVVVFGTTWNSGLVYEERIQGTTAVIVVIWGILLYRAKGKETYNTMELLTASILFGGLSFFMGFMWHQGYITNTPLIGINAIYKGLDSDTLYHSAIASSIAYYGYPSVLINSDAFHRYYFGSHALLGFTSKILEMPTIFTYSYIYPMVFFPLYSSLVLAVGKGIKRFIGKEERITIPDIIVVMSFMTFFILPKEWSDSIANWKNSWLVSESFCIANVLSLLFVKMWLDLSKAGFFRRKSCCLFFSLIIAPLFIGAIALTKISVALTVSFIISYLFFRTKEMNCKYFLLESLYVGIPFIIHYILFTIDSPFVNSAIEPTKLFPLHFMLTYVKNYGYGFHILVSFFFAFVFILYRLRKVTTFSLLLKGISQKKYLIEELMFLVCIFVSLPGMIIKIHGGSAFYFLALEQLVAVVLLIGYNIPDEIFDRIKLFWRKNIQGNCIYKGATIVVILCLCANFLVSSSLCAKQLLEDCSKNKVQKAESVKENSYWATIERINNLSAGHKEDYYIYVCQSANVWEKFNERIDSAIYFYPAMTGIVCIGELYFEEGKLYTNNNVLISDGGYEPLTQEAKLTEEGAYNKAKEDGKKAIIYIHDNSMSLVEIES